MRNAAGMVMKLVLVPSRELIIPVGERMMRTIPQRTMTEMKFGI